MFATALAVLAVPTAMVQAQDSSLRVGIFYPADSFTQTAGKNWLTFGVDFRLRDLSSNADGSKNRIQLSVDFVQKGDYRTVPVTLNYVSDSNPLYFFGGAGASFTRLRNNENDLEDQIRFAYQVGLGYKLGQFKAPIFVEVKWMGTTESRLNGWGAFVGVRF